MNRLIQHNYGRNTFIYATLNFDPPPLKWTVAIVTNPLLLPIHFDNQVLRTLCSVRALDTGIELGLPSLAGFDDCVEDFILDLLWGILHERVEEIAEL